jgi:hypothetical protein
MSLEKLRGEETDEPKSEVVVRIRENLAERDRHSSVFVGITFLVECLQNIPELLSNEKELAKEERKNVPLS